MILFNKCYMIKHVSKQEFYVSCHVLIIVILVFLWTENLQKPNWTYVLPMDPAEIRLIIGRH